MSTTFRLRIDPESELGQKLQVHLDNTEPGYAVNNFKTDTGFYLHYNREGKYWNLYTDDECLVVPRRYRESGLEIVSLTFFKSNCIYDRKSPWQGIYRPDGEFAGCIGTVDGYVGSKGGGNAIAITLTAPPALIERFHNAVRSRALRPTEWWEPEPEQPAPPAPYVPWWVRAWRALTGRPAVA